MIQRDVDAIAGGAVDDPRGATEAMIGSDGVDRAVARFGGANPALFSFGRDDGDRVAGGEESENEFVEEDAVDAVVVGDEKFHESVTKHETVERENPRNARGVR
jgi:hypothetical protein